MTNYEISLVFSTEVPGDTFDQSVAIAQLLCPAMPKELVDSSGNDAGEGPVEVGFNRVPVSEIPEN